MKVTFQVETEKSIETISNKILAADGWVFLVDQSHLNEESLEEMSAIVFSDLTRTELDKIQNISPELKSNHSKDECGTVFIDNNTLAVHKSIVKQTHNSYRLTLYLELIVNLEKGLTPYGNFEFLLESSEKALHQHYLHWRNKICTMFPEQKILQQFQAEEQIAYKNAKLRRLQCGLNMRQKMRDARKNFALFPASELKNYVDNLFNQPFFDFANKEKEDPLFEKEVLDLKVNIHNLKQKRI